VKLLITLFSIFSTLLVEIYFLLSSEVVNFRLGVNIAIAYDRRSEGIFHLINRLVSHSRVGLFYQSFVDILDCCTDSSFCRLLFRFV